MTYSYYINNKTLQRQSIRTYIRTIRHALTLQEKHTAAQLITNKIIAINNIYQSKNVAIFLSFDGEIETKLLIKTLLLMKKNIYLPITPISNTQYLSFAKYTLSTPLIKNRFNIYEPQYNITSIISIEILDVMFIPLVAFDKNRNRLGMGSGFYDKTLKKYSKNKFSYIPIGLAYDFQKIPTTLLPIEPWDIKLPEIITPNNHWH